LIKEGDGLMGILISTKNMSREEWLRCRKQGIGGSDAGAVCGVNPYVSPATVYADKTSEEIRIEDNESMRQGRDFEDYVAKRFCEATGLKVRRSNMMYQHPDYPWMLADVDRLICGEKAGLECKTASAFSSDKWRDISSLPDYYMVQCQHYMAVMDWPYMYLACVVLGKDFAYYRIDRNNEMIQNIIQLEKYFWEENVMKRCLPEPDGSKAFDELIGGSYFNPKKDTVIPLLGMDSELSRRADITRMITKLETEKKAIDQHIKVYMNENETAENDRYRITWKYSETTGQRRFMVKEVA